MVTHRKRWPNNAEWARMDAIARLTKCQTLMMPILEEQLTTTEIIRRVALVAITLQEIQTLLNNCKSQD